MAREALPAKKKIRELHKGDNYLIWGGMLPRALGQALMLLIPPEGHKGICTERYGAKMGIGRDKNCQCGECSMNKKVGTLVSKLQKVICEAAEDQWKLRNERWQEYCDDHEFQTPRSIRAGGKRGRLRSGERWRMWKYRNLTSGI